MKRTKYLQILCNRVLFVNYYRLPIYKWSKKENKNKALRIQKVTKENVDVVAKRYQKIENFMCQYTEGKERNK